MKTTTMNFRLDETLKNDASKVAEFYGMDLATVTRAVYTQMVRTRSIPLDLKSETHVPNEETRRALVLAEAKEMGLIPDDSFTAQSTDDAMNWLLDGQ